MPHYLLTYDLAPDYLERRAEFRHAHLALAWKAVDDGKLALGGAVGDPIDSALLIFTDEASASAFAHDDPYVREGLVERWRVTPWHTVVGQGASAPVR